MAETSASKCLKSKRSKLLLFLNSLGAAIKKTQRFFSILRPISAAALPKMSATSIHITALDGIVNVNSLFTFAVFIGLAWDPADTNNNLIDPTQPPDCSPSSTTAERLVCFHVYSFSCFLFSSLVALGLKQAIRLARDSPDHWPIDLALVNKTGLRVAYAFSAAGSVCGSVFLMLALVDVVQIKLGMLGCGGSRHGFAAVVPLVILVPSGLLIYICTVLYAFTR